MNLEIINVGNGNKNYPGNFTKKEITIIKKWCTGKILNLFSGKSEIGNVRIDFTYGNIIGNVFDILNEYDFYDFDTVIIDAPYNQKFGNKYQKIGNTPKQFIIFASTKLTTELFNLIKNNINPDIIIIKSWNYYIPKDYYLEKGYLCYPGVFRKSTILENIKKK